MSAGAEKLRPAHCPKGLVGQGSGVGVAAIRARSELK